MATRSGREGDGPRGGAPGPRRGVYMISVAAELAGMHPQTLRIYEARGLIEPERSAGNTRLYSQEDVERLRRIQELTTEMGMNLAGVERVFELELELERVHSRMEYVRRQAERAERELRDEIERVRRSFKAELVPYQAPGSALIPARDARVGRVRIPISRSRPRGDGSSAA
jgi:MerR family transcriptional regulator/heat shock protein HspR